MRIDLELDITNENELPAAARALLDLAGDTKIMLFDAPMGAGKTTLIKEICLALGSGDHFSSPTYSIINEYDFPDGKIYHFDLYRIKDRNELMDLGIEDHLAPGNYCFFEWPTLVEALVQDNYVKVALEVTENKRYLRATLLTHA